MSFAAGRPRPRAKGLPAVRSYPRRGSVRRAQLITTYGVGSMIAIDNESFIIAGLDSWNVSEAPRIRERRLARALKVSTFRLPPASDDTSKDGVRVRRFPLWHSCPGCDALQPVRKFNPPPGRNECGDCAEDLVPSRFVVACAKGHLDDFPYWKWVHRNNRQEGAVGHCGGELRLKANGKTASLRSILISCTCGVPEVSMEGAFRRSTLAKLKVRCEGRRPWLKDGPNDDCTESPRTLQRGSSAAWHPIVRSAISIPPWGEGLHLLIDSHLDGLAGRSDEAIAAYLEGAKILDGTEHTVAAVIDLVRAVEEEDPASEETPTARSTFAALRTQEYERLSAGHPERESAREQQFVCEPPIADLTPVSDLGVVASMLVKRLREVRALKSFTRVEPPGATSDELREAPLSLTALDWLPAMEVLGEGVFLRLDEARLDTWAEQVAVSARAERIRTNHLRLLKENASDPKAPLPDSPVSPRYVLLHTLAHVLINEWSLDGGYPAASLRERLYADETMAGVLLYTATSDSAGSLGGVVAQGEPEQLSDTLRSALRRSEWCSTDPLCLEAEASGADSVNLAACHACVLLPETSCETNNSFLDRALLIGAPENPSIGFFRG